MTDVEEMRKLVFEEVARDLGMDAAKITELHEKPAFKKAIDDLMKKKEKAVQERVMASEEEALKNHPEAPAWVAELDEIEMGEVSLAKQEVEIKQKRAQISEKRKFLRSELNKIAPSKYAVIATAAKPKKEKKEGEERIQNWKAYMLGLQELGSATVKSWATHVRTRFGQGNEGDLWNNIKQGSSPLAAAISDGTIDVDTTKKPAEFKLVGSLDKYL